MIPKEALKEFKELYRKRFQVELSDEETYKRASKLLNLYKTIYGSILRNTKKTESKNLNIS